MFEIEGFTRENTGLEFMKSKLDHRIILHIDMDYYYAAVEEREDPDLKGKAVAVCMFTPRGEEGGAITTANYKARESGIHSGMSCSKARKLDPKAVFLPVNFDLYWSTSDRIMEILGGYADNFEQVSVDEAFLDVSSKVNDFNRAKKLAVKIKKEVFDKEKLTCSIGIGPNKLIAKMASGVIKPDGLTVIEPDEILDFLKPLKLTKLWGVGKKTEAKLNEMGVSTVGELSEIEVGRLVDVFGKAKGVWLHQASKGIDNSPVEERKEREQIGRMTTLEEDTRDFDAISEKLEDMAQEVFAKITEKKLMFKTVTITAITQDFKIHTKSRTLPNPTDDFETIKRVSRELMAVFLDGSDLKLRRVGIRVSGFSQKRVQKTFFEF
ncbi:MAG: DNA polymerase IV [Candidatus Hydrothermarchaeales archaeon]